MVISSRVGLLGFVAVVAALAACTGPGGNLSGVSPLQPTPKASPQSSPSPILVAGTVASYTGTDVTAHVFASPTASQQNYTAGYSFTETSTTSTAASGAPAAFDVNSTIAYTTTQVPTAGTQRTTVTSDNFVNQTASGANEIVTIVASKAVSTGIDVTGGAAGGGPYTVTTTTTTNYTTPRILGVYPLAASTLTEPLARTVALATTDVNAAGTQPADTFEASGTETYANDGSYVRNKTLSNGETDTLTENANGTVTNSESGPIFALQETIGLPVAGAGGEAIPVTSTRQDAMRGATPAPAATTAAFSAVDWYPSHAQPAQPLETDVLTVKGATTTLPAACSGAISEPNVIEVDETVTTLDIDGSITVDTSQHFDANGTNVCALRTTTTNDYDIDTGSPVQTISETYAQILTKLTGTTAARALAR